VQLLKNFLAFYGTQRFITVFTGDHELITLFTLQANAIITIHQANCYRNYVC
jgi:hypothetical protein